MIEAHKARVEGGDFQFRHFPTKQSIKILTRLLKMVAAPAVRGLSSGDGKSILEADIQFDKVVDGFLQNITDDGVIELCEMILEHVEIKGKGAEGYRDINMESDFHGHIDQLFAVVKEAVVFNYADLVKKNMKAFKAAKGRAEDSTT